jgi:hypothetical protein
VCLLGASFGASSTQAGAAALPPNLPAPGDQAAGTISPDAMAGQWQLLRIVNGPPTLAVDLLLRGRSLVEAEAQQGACGDDINRIVEHDSG